MVYVFCSFFFFCINSILDQTIYFFEGTKENLPSYRRIEVTLKNWMEAEAKKNMDGSSANGLRNCENRKVLAICLTFFVLLISLIDIFHVQRWTFLTLLFQAIILLLEGPVVGSIPPLCSIAFSTQVSCKYTWIGSSSPNIRNESTCFIFFYWPVVHRLIRASNQGIMGNKSFGLVS